MNAVKDIGGTAVSLWEAIHSDELGLSEEQKKKLSEAEDQESTERRQRERINDLEEQLQALTKKVEALMKKVFDIDEDEAEAIMSDVCVKGCW
jgi:ATP-dependent Clp protease adapter protein ClpS